MDLDKWIAPCVELAKQAGIAILDFWQQRIESLEIKYKSDNTPFTLADIKAHHILVEGLQRLTPDLPILSEEGDWPEYAQRARWDAFWLLDPLDGTRGFIRHLKEFSVNIALIVQHVPVLGIIYIPVEEICYYAEQKSGAFKQIGNQAPVTLQKPFSQHVPELWKVLIGHFQKGQRLMQRIGNKVPFQFIRLNSSIKFGWLAEGRADVYPRLSAICEWDTAAGQCILKAAGGAVVDLQGRALQYNRKTSLLNPDFIALGDPRWMDLWLKILNEESN